MSTGYTEAVDAGCIVDYDDAEYVVVVVDAGDMIVAVDAEWIDDAEGTFDAVVADGCSYGCSHSFVGSRLAVASLGAINCEIAGTRYMMLGVD